MPEDLSALPGLIRQVLASPHGEETVRGQVLELAAGHLHQPGVLLALVEVLPQVEERATRGRLLDLLLAQDASRFDDPAAFHGALLATFRVERERAVRVRLLDRLGRALAQDARVIPFLLAVLAEPELGDEERCATLGALGRDPAPTPETVRLALERTRTAPAEAQALALALAFRLPAWDERVVRSLIPFLDVKVDRRLRLELLHRLAGAGRLTPDDVPVLGAILRADPEDSARLAALRLLALVRPWGAAALEQLLWSAARDALPAVRAEAAQLLAGQPELSGPQLSALAAALAADASSGVRTRILGVLGPYLRDPGVRRSVAAAFGRNPSAFGDEELGALCELLAPYVGRDAELRQALQAAAASLPLAPQREALVRLILDGLDVGQVLPWLLELFQRERTEGIRALLFTRIRPLSLARHPKLVPVLCAELADPGSPFRQECASALAGSPPPAAAAPALAEVLRHDRERELVRTCLEAYLRLAGPRDVEALLAVVGREGLDPRSRQAAVEALVEQGLPEAQRERLATLLAEPHAAGLRMPR